MKRVPALPALLIASCIPVTVNLTFAFPPKEMEQKLVDMEKKVREEERPKSPAAAFDPVPEGFQDPNINVETPAIKEINERRRKRAGDVKGHFAAGRLGEGKDALVAEREAGDLGGREKAAFRKLMKEENEDRTSLLKEILKANKLADDQLDEVQHVYARALMKVADLGWWLETPSGKWVKKTEEHQKLLDKGKAIE